MAISLGNGVGRIASGLQMFCPQQVMISNSASALFSALTVTCFRSCVTQAQFIGVSLAYGFASGPLLGLLTQSCAHLVHLPLLGLAIGVNLTLDGAMGLLGPPVVASLETLFSDQPGSPLYVVTGCLSVAALLFLIADIAFRQRQQYSTLA